MYLSSCHEFQIDFLFSIQPTDKANGSLIWNKKPQTICCTWLKIDKHAKMPLGFWVSRQPQHSTRYIDKKSKKIKRCGRCVIACQVTDIEGDWQGWQLAGSGNLPVSGFSLISDYFY